MADALNIKKMKVAELKKELTAHGLETKGNKSELQERLKEFFQQQGVEVDHSGDTGEEEVEDDLEHVTTGEDEEEEISDDVLAEESLEQKPNKVTPLNDAENKEPLPEAVQPKKAEETPIKQAPVTAKAVITKPLTEEERKLQRMKRFGSPASEDNKKLARAQRFGSNTTSSVSSPESTDLNKLKKRAERFGAVSPVVSKIVDHDKMLKRKERFGASLITADDSIEAKKKKRAERFST